MLNIFEMAKDTAIVTIDLNEQTHTHEIASLLSLTNVTDRQKSPVFYCKKYGNPNPEILSRKHLRTAKMNYAKNTH